MFNLEDVQSRKCGKERMFNQEDVQSRKCAKEGMFNLEVKQARVRKELPILRPSKISNLEYFIIIHIKATTWHHLH